MWYVRDELYALLYVRVSCFVVRGCGQQFRHSGGVRPQIQGENDVHMWVELKRRCVCVVVRNGA